MPQKTTVKRARADLRAGKSPSTAAGEFVREEMEHIRRGKHGARSPEQANCDRVVQGAASWRTAQAAPEGPDQKEHPPLGRTGLCGGPGKTEAEPALAEAQQSNEQAPPTRGKVRGLPRRALPPCEECRP